jgi:hypothetical protein
MARNLIDRDLGWRKIKRQFKDADGLAVKVGIQANAGGRRDGPSHYEVAAAHEFGKGNLPQRAFIGGTVDHNKAKYLKELRGVGFAIAAAKSAVGFLKLVGRIVRNDIVDRITQGGPPPFEEWKESTLRRKEAEGKAGSPILFDTGQLKDAVRSVVTRGDREVIGG